MDTGSKFLEKRYYWKELTPIPKNLVFCGEALLNRNFFNEKTQTKSYIKEKDNPVFDIGKNWALSQIQKKINSL